MTSSLSAASAAVMPSVVEMSKRFGRRFDRASSGLEIQSNNNKFKYSIRLRCVVVGVFPLLPRPYDLFLPKHIVTVLRFHGQNPRSQAELAKVDCPSIGELTLSLKLKEAFRCRLAHLD